MQEVPMDDPGRAAGGAMGEYAYQSSGGERPVMDVLKDIFGNVEEMVRSELRLARAEIREETKKAARSGALLAAGGVVGIIGAIFLLASVAQLLSLVMPDWASTLIIGFTLAIVAAILISKGRAGLRVPAPDRAFENMKENVEWMKNQTKS
jgi:hypothetical protein